MQQDKNGWLIGWVCFIGFVTWLDWLGIYIVYLAALPSWLSQGMYFLLVILFLLWLRACSVRATSRGSNVGCWRFASSG